MEINTTEAKIFKTKKMNPFYKSLIFLGFVIILTGGLYIYNIVLENNIRELENNISKKQISISNLEKQPKIIAKKLYDLNINSIKKLEDYSNITFYINHLYNLQRKYKINFKGFRISSGNIITQVNANSDNNMINYDKVYNFIKNYRNSTGSLFDLDLVKSITQKEGINDIFNINLKLKNNINSILVSLKKKQQKINADKLARQKALAEKLKLLKQKIKTNSGSINK